MFSVMVKGAVSLAGRTASFVLLLFFERKNHLGNRHTVCGERNCNFHQYPLSVAYGHEEEDVPVTNFSVDNALIHGRNPSFTPPTRKRHPYTQATSERQSRERYIT